MKKLSSNIFFVLLVFISFSSCSKSFLDKEPLDNPSTSTFLQSEEEMELAINGVYASLWYSINYGIPIEQHLDLASDIGWSRAFVDFQFLGNGEVDPNNSVILDIWKHFYSGIESANYVLEKAVGISDVRNQARFDQLMSEAKFIRAYYYYHLTEMFGDVPYVTKELSLANSHLGKTSKSSIVDSLLADLEEAAQYLPISYSKPEETGRVTKGAALALKSRIALFNARWDIAIDASRRVMELDYSLDNDYSALYLKENQVNSEEIILLLNYKQGAITHEAPQWVGSRMSSGYAGLIPTQDMIDSYLSIDGLTIDKSPLYNPMRPYENRDPRLNFSVVVPGAVFNGYQYETHKDSLLCWNYNVVPPIRVANQDATNPYASFSGYCWRKYSDKRDPTYQSRSETGIILIRYAEVLLNYAEAKVEANEIDQSVYDAINQIRQRVQMPEITEVQTQLALRSIVRMERKSELAFEGLRLYDIRRWRMAEHVLDGPLYGRIPTGLLNSAPVIDENGTPDYSRVSNKNDMKIIETKKFDKAKNYVWPIPQYEIDINDAVKQNDGY